MVGTDVAADQPRLVVVDGRVAVLEVDLGLPERLDLGALQDEPRFVRLEDGVVVERLPGGRDHFLVGHGRLTSGPDPTGPLTSTSRSVSSSPCPGPKCRDCRTRMTHGPV